MILEKKSWSSKENNVLFTLVCLQTNTALLSFIFEICATENEPWSDF